MNLLTVLKNIFKNSEFELLNQNELYGFDIYLCKPKHKRCQIVFTIGLSNQPQQTPDKFTDFKFVELYFCLPEYWKIDKTHWSVTYINKVAQIPKKNSTWFGPGDTIPTANPPVNISDKFPFSYFMLVEPVLLDKEIKEIIIEDKKIKFFGILPLYKIEFNYKMRNSAKVLTAKFQYLKINEMVDEYRKSVVRKRILGLF